MVGWARMSKDLCCVHDRHCCDDHLTTDGQQRTHRHMRRRPGSKASKIPSLGYESAVRLAFVQSVDSGDEAAEHLTQSPVSQLLDVEDRSSNAHAESRLRVTNNALAAKVSVVHLPSRCALAALAVLAANAVLTAAAVDEVELDEELHRVAAPGKGA